MPASLPRSSSGNSLLRSVALLSQQFFRAQSASVQESSPSGQQQGSTASIAPAAAFTVSNTSDNGSGSLRQAVLDANAAPGADTITFSALFNTVQTITLTSGEIAISGPLTITGPGANLLTVSGNNNSRIFRIGFGVPGVSISGLTISNGKAGDVGGGIVSDGDLTLTNCAVTGNSAASGFSGGGVYQAGGVGTFTACTFSGNTAGSGGGLEIINSNASIFNSTISGNTATINGGGIQFDTIAGGNKTLMLQNSTIANNTSPAAGGLRVVSSGGSLATAQPFDSIIANNSTTNLSTNNAQATITSQGFNLSDNWSGVATLGSDLTAPPLLGPLALNGGPTPTHALLGGSPALNQGSNPLGLTTNQRGLPRVNGVSVDIGAFEAQAIIVTTNADNVPGSLRDAITNAPANSDILFEPVFFNVARTITLDGTQLAIAKNLTINGPGANLLTVSGNNASRVFNINGNFNVSLSGLTITGGNTSSGGGGIINFGGTLTMSNSTISGNTAGFGGGIRNAGGGMLTVTNSTISGNTATGSGSGGGIDSGNNLTVTNSTISGNSAPNGDNNGGGLRLAFGTPTASITNSTITNNSAGGAASASGVFRSTGTVTIRNSIIARNVNNANQPDVVANGGTGITSNGFNLIGNRGTVAFGSTNQAGGNGNPILNPLLGPLQNNLGLTQTHALAYGSPALDKGSNTGSGITTDQRGTGFNRVFDDPVITNAAGGDGTDIGAFEAHFAPPPSVVSIGRSSTNPTTPGATVSYTVTFSAGVFFVDATDFALTTTGLTGASVTGVTGFGSTRTVNVSTGTGTGTLRLDVTDDDSVVEGTGAPLGGLGAGNGSFNSGEVYTVAAPPAMVQFSASNYSVVEDCATVTIAVNRTGDASGTATVDYSTADVTATDRRDYIIALGRLTFAPGETSKSIALLINEDSYVEGTETFNISLSNPSGANLGAAIATVTITDDATEPSTNVVDDPQTFVCQHYHDFLNREPDLSGLNFWTNQITSCSGDPQCIEVKRINVSASFFLSIEFQGTGYLVERLYKAAYGDASGASTFPGPHQIPVPVVRFNEFLFDAQKIGQGVIVNQGNWEQQLENNRQAFIAEFVQRSRFTTAFPGSMTDAQFVDTLNTNAGNPLSAAERNQLVNNLTAQTMTRAQVLRAVAEDSDLNSAEFNRAFVLMQYLGYLRRNPNDPQDSDYTGYDFWLTKLDQFNGNFVNAEMVKAFISSAEYRQRFGP